MARSVNEDGSDFRCTVIQKNLVAWGVLKNSQESDQLFCTYSCPFFPGIVMHFCHIAMLRKETSFGCGDYNFIFKSGATLSLSPVKRKREKEFLKGSCEILQLVCRSWSQQGSSKLVWWLLNIPENIFFEELEQMMQALRVVLLLLNCSQQAYSQHFTHIFCIQINFHFCIYLQWEIYRFKPASPKGLAWLLKWRDFKLVFMKDEF